MAAGETDVEHIFGVRERSDCRTIHHHLDEDADISFNFEAVSYREKGGRELWLLKTCRSLGRKVS